jgi:hypothetical protein
VIGVKPNPNWLPLTLFVLVLPGPFTFDLSQFSSTLVGYYYNFFLSREAECSQASLEFNATGGNNVLLFFDQTASDRWPTRTETEGRCFARSDAFSGEIHSASCKLKEYYETRRDKRYII